MSVQVACESCGGSDTYAVKSDGKCRGCGMLLCQSCADVFDHWGGGLHGKGDPHATARALRASLAALEAERDRLTKGCARVALDLGLMREERDRLRAVVTMYLEEDGDPSRAGGNAFVRHVCHSDALRSAARAALAGQGAGEGRADG